MFLVINLVICTMFARNWSRCNVQQQFSSLIFRGCESLNLLTYLSLTTFTMLAVALWCFVIGAGLVAAERFRSAEEQRDGHSVLGVSRCGVAIDWARRLQ